MELRNLFADLGLGIDATAAEVQAAYRRRALEHHPDRNPGSPQASHEGMVIVNKAYEVLRVDEARAAHRNALQAHWNANRTGLGAVLSDKGFVMPDAFVMPGARTRK